MAKDAEVLALRHQNAVLRRQIARVRYEPADRVWLAIALLQQESDGMWKQLTCGFSDCEFSELVHRNLSWPDIKCSRTCCRYSADDLAVSARAGLELRHQLPQEPVLVGTLNTVRSVRLSLCNSCSVRNGRALETW
ncbi:MULTISPECIES: hypothetical protein [unclassified Streptomyces]|uniref:hypothetical protein n=1 Tax=unclassified Streptomyces TaxID=2593676 RepID=UPI003D8CAE3B